MPNIYAIATKWRSIEDQLEESGGEITEEIAAELAEVESATDDAVQALVCLTKEREATNNFIKQEVVLLNQRRKTNESVIETYAKTLTKIVNDYGVMNSNGYKKYEVGPHKVSFRESKSTEVNNELISFIIDYVKREIEHQHRTYADDKWIEFPPLSRLAEDITAKAMGYNPDLLVTGWHDVADMETGEITHKPYYTNVTEDDIKNLNVNISFNVPLSTLLSATENDETFDLLLALQYFNGEISPAVSKTDLKAKLANSIMAIAKIQTNANLQIK
jgi:hypothetical protein